MRNKFRYLHLQFPKTYPTIAELLDLDEATQKWVDTQRSDVAAKEVWCLTDGSFTTREQATMGFDDTSLAIAEVKYVKIEVKGQGHEGGNVQ